MRAEGEGAKAKGEGRCAVCGAGAARCRCRAPPPSRQAPRWASRRGQPLFCSALCWDLRRSRQPAAAGARYHPACWSVGNCTHEIPTDFLLRPCCREALSASGNLTTYSHDTTYWWKQVLLLKKKKYIYIYISSRPSARLCLPRLPQLVRVQRAGGF
jgi:hypothetical protein